MFGINWVSCLIPFCFKLSGKNGTYSLIYRTVFLEAKGQMLEASAKLWKKRFLKVLIFELFSFVALPCACVCLWNVFAFFQLLCFPKALFFVFWIFNLLKKRFPSVQFKYLMVCEFLASLETGAPPIEFFLEISSDLENCRRKFRGKFCSSISSLISFFPFQFLDAFRFRRYLDYWM